MALPTHYIIDASSLIGLARHRPAGRHARLWQRLGDLIHTDRLVSPIQVFEELRIGKDPLAVWAKQCRRDRRLFKATTREIAGVAREIIRRFPDLVDVNRPSEQADPFVVALAVAESKRDMFPPPCTVITDEKFTFTGRARIPKVCGEYKMPYLTIHQMFLIEGWAI
jgi:hypothetical protein